MTQGFMEIPDFAASVRNVDRSASKGRVDVVFNMPLVLYLVSEACQATHGVFSQNSGRYAKVRIAAADGWVSPMGSTPTVEDIAEHFDQICDPAVWHEPLTVYEEFNAVASAARRQGRL